jgi:hypothetical protein
MRPKCRIVEPDEKSAQEYVPFYERWLTSAKWLDDLYDKIG